ncbi:MAG TPA: type II 3-dehydroquinate dehydratase [Chitinophagaceae bacterium]|nr:type II 3-dehydroquinate dehydratase [Chitinophagaceae bacterium]
MKKIKIINGPNLNLLGKREPDIYGSISFEDYLNELKTTFYDIDIEHVQSNHEGVLIDEIQKSTHLDGIVLNAAAYSHTSIAIADAIAAINTPTVEVHISNIYQRESFRHLSLVSPNCVGVIVGFGLEGYKMAVRYFLEKK